VRETVSLNKNFVILKKTGKNETWWGHSPAIRQKHFKPKEPYLHKGGADIKPTKGIAISIILLTLGGALLLLGLYLGPTGGISLYICIPPLFMKVHPVAGLGVILIFIGTMGIFVSLSARRLEGMGARFEDLVDEENGYEPERRPTKMRKHHGLKTGGIIFLGPIPIVWGSDRRIGRTMLYIAMVITGFLILLFILNGLMLVYGR